MKPISLSKHAEEKFETFQQRGFEIAPETVIETLRSPDKIESDEDQKIAQKRISDTKVLRVVYVESDSEIFVITFYPGERKRYEDQI